MKPIARRATIPQASTLIWAVTALVAAHAAAQEAPTTAFAAFGSRMVGVWQGSGTRHVFEWGLDGRVVHSHSYESRGDEWVLVSEGFWYADPELDAVRGVAVATGMPVELFEYATSVRSDEVVHELRAHGPMGGRFIERWRFDGDRYEWTLEQAGERLMGGVLVRVEGPAQSSP